MFPVKKEAVLSLLCIHSSIFWLSKCNKFPCTYLKKCLDYETLPK